MPDKRWIIWWVQTFGVALGWMFLVTALGAPRILSNSGLVVILLLCFWWGFQRITGWINTIGRTYVRGETSARLDDLLQKHIAGDNSPQTLISISFACYQLGRGAEAEFYAREACAVVSARPAVPLARDLAYLALTKALVLQGRLAEAAHQLHEYLPQAEQANNVRAQTAWTYYLADNMDGARAVLTKLKPPNRFLSSRVIIPDMQLMVAYMQFKLLDIDISDTLHKQGHRIQNWLGEWHQHRSSPYGERLGQILADVFQLLPMGWFYWGSQRILTGDTERLLEETLTRRNQGDYSYQNTLILSAAYAYLGRGQEAEPLAYEAKAAIESEGWFQKAGDEAHLICDLAYIAIHDALLTQGRYDESARALIPRVMMSEKANRNRLWIAWAYSMGGDLDNARVWLKQIKPSTDHPRYNLLLRHQFTVAYLQYRLLGQDTRQRMYHLRDQLKE
jgi:tetratricopeptide (TPR) repeat protein